MHSLKSIFIRFSICGFLAASLASKNQATPQIQVWINPDQENDSLQKETGIKSVFFIRQNRLVFNKRLHTGAACYFYDRHTKQNVCIEIGTFDSPLKALKPVPLIGCQLKTIKDSGFFLSIDQKQVELIGTLKDYIWRQIERAFQVSEKLPTDMNLFHSQAEKLYDLSLSLDALNQIPSTSNPQGAYLLSSSCTLILFFDLLDECISGNIPKNYVVMKLSHHLFNSMWTLVN
jgi:hypothetical protein